MSTVQYCLKLQNIIYCIVNLKKASLTIIKLQVLERHLHILYFKVLIKNLKTHMTSHNVALWDINIALWAIFLFIVTRIFHLGKMTYLTFN